MDDASYRSPVARASPVRPAMLQDAPDRQQPYSSSRSPGSSGTEPSTVPSFRRPSTRTWIPGLSGRPTSSYIPQPQRTGDAGRLDTFLSQLGRPAPSPGRADGPVERVPRRASGAEVTDAPPRRTSDVQTSGADRPARRGDEAGRLDAGLSQQRAIPPRSNARGEPTPRPWGVDKLHEAVSRLADAHPPPLSAADAREPARDNVSIRRSFPLGKLLPRRPASPRPTWLPPKDVFASEDTAKVLPIEENEATEPALPSDAGQADASDRPADLPPAHDSTACPPAPSAPPPPRRDPPRMRPDATPRPVEPAPESGLPSAAQAGDAREQSAARIASTSARLFGVNRPLVLPGSRPRRRAEENAGESQPRFGGAGDRGGRGRP
jgi:hypothetical protein